MKRYVAASLIAGAVVFSSSIPWNWSLPSERLPLPILPTRPATSDEHQIDPQLVDVQHLEARIGPGTIRHSCWSSVRSAHRCPGIRWRQA